MAKKVIYSYSTKPDNEPAESYLLRDCEGTQNHCFSSPSVPAMSPSSEPRTQGPLYYHKLDKQQREIRAAIRS